MTEISYLIGTTVSSRHDLLERKMQALKNKSFLHVVPTKGRVMELETDPLFWLNRRVNTLTGVIHQIFEEDIRPEKYADYSHMDRILGQLLIKKALINRSKEPRGLAYFHSLFANDGIDRDFPGICRNISGFFSTLYQNNYEDIYANDLGGRIIWQEEIDPGTADEKYALESDLLWLMGDYEELKREIKGYDDDDILKNVRDFLKEKKYTSYIAGCNVIILDSLTHISRIEEEILYHLISSVEELWWLIDYDMDCDDPLTGFREACGREADRAKNIRAKEGDLESLRVCYSIISLMDRLHEDGFPFRMENALRVPYPNPYGGAIYTNRGPDMDLESGTLKIGSFHGEVDEVRAIASEIKRILFEQVADKNMHPGNIRVIFPDLNDYSSIVSEIFTEYGLPFSLTKGIPLSSHPLSNIFLKIFQLPIEGFRREDLFGLFSMKVIDPELLRIELPEFSPDIFPSNHYLPGETREDLNTLFDTITSGGSPKTGIHIFDTALRRCGVDHLGLDLENLSPDKITVFVEIYSSLINDTKDADEKIALRHEYYMFLYQRMIFDLILTPFTALLTCRTPEKIVETFDQLIRLLGFPSNIININKRDIGIGPSAKRRMLKRDIRAFTLLKELLNISHREMRLAQRLFDIEKSDILLSSFYKAFINRINNKYLLDERNPEVIRISQWLETRGRSFEYVFAGGLTSSRFPLKEEPDFIIPESSRGLPAKKLQERSLPVFS